MTTESEKPLFIEHHRIGEREPMIVAGNEAAADILDKIAPVVTLETRDAFTALGERLRKQPLTAFAKWLRR